MEKAGVLPVGSGSGHASLLGRRTVLRAVLCQLIEEREVWFSNLPAALGKKNGMVHDQDRVPTLAQVWAGR
ncbi:hypothetical protein, partial [Pontiella sp.]|uniref:hypothetical protein n=1 Tax=Pontiella sp. TaxID=2837462 RepID=UPI003562E80C